MASYGCGVQQGGSARENTTQQEACDAEESLFRGLGLSLLVFAKNNRIKKVTLLFSTGGSVSLSFADKRGLQSVPLVCAPGPNIETTFVKLVIGQVYPGSNYDDTCLAEIEVWGRTLARGGAGLRGAALLAAPDYSPRRRR